MRFSSRVSVVLFLAAACGDGAGVATTTVPEPVTLVPTPIAIVRDDFGEPLTRPSAPAMRVVSLNPTTTEILFAMGKGDRLVGRSRWDQWPDSARAVPAVGDGIRPDVESVLAVKPDLVLLYASADNRDAATRLRSMGIAVAAFKVDRIADFRRVTMELGELLGDPERALSVVDSVQRTLDRVAAATAQLPRPSVFMPAWESPLMTIGGGSFLSELVTIAGGRNIYEALPAPSPMVTMEDVARLDPDIVLTGPESEVKIRDKPRWRVLRAVREGRVMTWDTVLVGRPSVRIGEAARSLANLLHPGVVR
ncbi:MAG: ABC-type transporter, periplasmic subunit [Gemmatimonadetes bacterium]|nr:ABC-type transporter, periplasmic subunit [Gemmatimonadota bacterium]